MSISVDHGLMEKNNDFLMLFNNNTRIKDYSPIFDICHYIRIEIVKILKNLVTIKINVLYKKVVENLLFKNIKFTNDEFLVFLILMFNFVRKKLNI